MDFIDFENKKIMITGASSGIGRATAILLSKLNAEVVLCGRNVERLEETISMMENPKKHKFISFDVKDFDNYEKYFDKAIEDGKKLNGLVHAAGNMKIIPIRSFSKNNIDEILDTHFKSYLLLVSMISKKKYSDNCCIVGISAINAHNPQQSMTIYAAAKSAIETATKTMALELSKNGSRINCIAPGDINTPMTQKFIKDFEKKKENKNFLLGQAEPIDVANMIAILLSDKSKFVTGRTFFVDCGSLGQML